MPLGMLDVYSKWDIFPNLGEDEIHNVCCWIFSNKLLDTKQCECFSYIYTTKMNDHAWGKTHDNVNDKSWTPTHTYIVVRSLVCLKKGKLASHLWYISFICLCLLITQQTSIFDCWCGRIRFGSHKYIKFIIIIIIVQRVFSHFFGTKTT